MRLKTIEKIYRLKTHPGNPRIIKDHKFRALVKSIKEFPEMLEVRSLVVNEKMQVIGGNMRLKEDLNNWSLDFPTFNIHDELDFDTERAGVPQLKCEHCGK